MKRRFIDIFLLQAFYCLPFSIGWGLSLLFYITLGFTAGQIVLYYVIYYATVLATLLMLRTHKAFSLMKLSLVFSAAGFLLMSQLESRLQFYLLAVIFGMASPLFWVAYNTTYFHFARKDANALSSGLMFLVNPVLNIVFPLFSGIIIGMSGFRVVFLFSTVAAGIALVYAHAIRDKTTLDLHAWHSMKPAEGVRTLVYLEGFWQGVCWTCVPLITLTFITTGFGYGSFLSYLGLFGAFASLALCRLSDKTRNRAAFILPVALLVSAGTIISGFIHSMGAWVLLNGLVSFFMAMASPFTLSVVLDKVHDVRDGMLAREIFLNLGRLSGVLAILASYLLFDSLHYPLIAAGIAFLLYPVVLKAKKLYPHHFSLRSIFSQEPYTLTET
jgi:hypothetical protein